MRIESVRIRNYRQYYNFDVSFDKKGDKSLYVLIARNGTGKSNFLNAITWCLYDKEPHLSDNYKALPTLSLKKLREMKKDEIANVSVEITISTTEDKYIIKRTKSIKKTEDREEPTFVMSNNLEFDSFGQHTFKYENEDARRQINKLLPEDLTEYFFFDNEQMDKYFKDNRGNSIKSSIHSISQVSLLEKIFSRLSTVEMDYTKAIGKKLPDIKKLSDTYEMVKSQRIDCERELENTIEQIEISKKIVEECDQYLNGIGDIRALHREQNEFIDLKNKRIEALKSNIIDLKSFAIRYSTLIHLYPDLVKTKKLIDSMEEAGKLPPLVDIEFLKRMLKDNMCLICGKEELSNDERVHIQSLIDDIQIPNRISHLLKGISSHIDKLVEETLQYQSKKGELFSKQFDIKKEINYFNSKIDDLQEEINKCADEKKAAAKAAAKQQHLILLEKNRERKLTEETRLKVYSKKEADAKFELDKAIKKDKDNLGLKVYRNRTTRLEEIVNNIKNEMISEMKTMICNETYDIFSSMVWKKNTYKEVTIDSNYNVDLLNYDGYSALGSCSAAERSLLALAFTLALHNVSGFDAPLVIDSPVGRISDTNRAEFAKVLVEVSRKKEVILLFTPSDYSEEIQPLYDEQCTSKRYIEVDEEEIQASVREG